MNALTVTEFLRLGISEGRIGYFVIVNVMKNKNHRMCLAAKIPCMVRLRTLSLLCGSRGGT